jgi:hypothetical protein
VHPDHRPVDVHVCGDLPQPAAPALDELRLAVKRWIVLGELLPEQMQLAALTFVTMADVKINLVPYRGTAPAVTDTIAGHVQLGIADPPPSMGAISEGKLKAIAVTSKQRFAVFPDVPSFEEFGLKDFDITGWFGIAAPAATPREIVTKLNTAVVAAVSSGSAIARALTSRAAFAAPEHCPPKRSTDASSVRWRASAVLAGVSTSA